MQRTTLLALVVRIGIALVTRTFFQPDEFFQSLEVAHHLVFGYGRLTWEWLSPNPIRSIIYPALNVPIYWTLKECGLDDTAMLIWAPKVLHGVFAACTDIWLCDLTRKVLGERYVPTAFFLSLTSLFHGLSLSRSLSNSLETSLTVVALSHLPWDPHTPCNKNDMRKMILFAGAACSMRPTNAVVWTYIFALLLFRSYRRQDQLVSLTSNILAIGCITLLVVVALDTLYYGAVTLTPVNFLRTNISSVSLFYGSSPWHYYLSQAIPILCTTALPFVLHGGWLVAHMHESAPRTLLGLIAWTIGIYSLAGHKEWRFIHPLLPFMHVLAAKSLVDMGRSGNRTSRLPIKSTHRIFILLSLPAIAYVALFHGKAQVDVTHFLRHLPARSIGFLMPCHSTPWQAYLHRADLADTGRLWALGCEPPLLGQDADLYQDQTDVFYDSPPAYLRMYFPDAVDPSFPPSPMPCTQPGMIADHWRHEWPEYLVLFGALLIHEEVRGLLETLGYREFQRFESGWEGDDRRRGGVRVLRFQPALD